MNRISCGIPSMSRYGPKITLWPIVIYNLWFLLPYFVVFLFLWKLRCWYLKQHIFNYLLLFFCRKERDSGMKHLNLVKHKTCWNEILFQLAVSSFGFGASSFYFEYKCVFYSNFMPKRMTKFRDISVRREFGAFWSRSCCGRRTLDCHSCHPLRAQLS